MATGDQSAAGEAAHQAAIDWVLALHESPDDSTLQHKLAAWLQADPAHAAAFEQARQTWLLTGLVPPRG
ncbi:MAG TPA: DUF4880 domain-containing protein [Burkholderiaceae bacterium]|nr:DUF4880 domain-containing protein [Burkholderiaceae bacterium]